jgi:hypothetical protein
MLGYTLRLVWAITLGLLRNVTVFKKEHWAICKNNQRYVKGMLFIPTFTTKDWAVFAPIAKHWRETEWIGKKWSALQNVDGVWRLGKEIN